MENRQAYSMKRGILRPIMFRTKYQSATLTINGKAYGTTIWRMMYCAQNGIDITKIPSDLCINLTNGILTVNSRSDIHLKAEKAKKMAAPTMERIEKNMKLIRQFYDGEVQPLIEYLNTVEQSVVQHYIFIYGFSKERADLIVGIAVNKYLDRLRDGYPTPYIKGTIYRYARKENIIITQQREFFDNMQPIEL